MQPPTDKQHVRAKLAGGLSPGGTVRHLWLTGQYHQRHHELGGEPGYTLKVGWNSTGAYYADRIVEWQATPAAGQMSLFAEVE